MQNRKYKSGRVGVVMVVVLLVSYLVRCHSSYFFRVCFQEWLRFTFLQKSKEKCFPCIFDITVVTVTLL